MPFFNKSTLLSNPSFLKGNLQIIACAGSGKTEFVSERIALQIEQKIARPEEVVAFTFTEKAAEELKFRVRSKIKELIGHQPDIGDMYIGTIHAFAFHLLQEYVPRYRGFDMLDDVGRLAFLSSIRSDIDIDYLTNSLKSRFRKPFGRTEQNWVFSVFLSDIDKVREEGWDVETVSVSQSFIKAYNVYLEKLNQKQFLDFSAILRIAVDTLKSNKSVLDKVRKQYKFFTVDEYQDVNPIQEELIQLISNKQNVCVVGDDDQSIYQWRGADVNNILTFQKRYSKVAIHKLEINRRSTDGVVSSGRMLIEVNKPRLDKSIKDKGVKSEPGDLFKLTFPNQVDEIEWIVKRIQSLVGTEYQDGNQIRKLNYSDMALLFRSIGNEAGPYLDALKEANIPVVFSGAGGLFDTLEVRSVMQMLEYICKCDGNVDYDEDWLKALHDSIKINFKINFKDFSEGIEKLESYARRQKRLSLQGFYASILSMLGLAKEEFHREENEVLLYNLGRLSTAITDYENSREYLTFKSIKDFIWFIRLHAENSYDSGPSDATANLIDAVQLMTMHGTKGLGFPAVFLPAHHKGKPRTGDAPSWVDSTKVDLSRFNNSDQDERRLYYVALTRAKKYLHATYSQVKIGNKRASKPKDLFVELSNKAFITNSGVDPTKRKPCSIEGVSEEARFPTSYSEMAYYLGCGYDYKMRFIYGFNPGIVQALGFGKQMHNLINLLHKDFEDTQTIPTPKRIKQLIDEHFYLRYAHADLKESIKKGAFRSLSQYVKMWEADFSLTVKTERPFEMEFNNALIAGSIDMIKRESSDGTTLEVIDFKTGKPENDLFEKYELQVQLYTIAAREALGLNTQNALIHFLDTTKKERLQVVTSDYALDNARQQIAFAINGITQMNFRRDARNNKKCAGCDWKKICAKRKGYRHE